MSQETSGIVPDQQPSEARRVRPRPAFRVRDLLGGLFAMGVAMLVCGALLFQNLRPLYSYYEARAERHFKAKRTSAFQVCLKRLLSIDPEQPALRYKLGLTYASLGQFDRAEEVLRSIASPDHLGYPEAHWWLAQRLLASLPTTVARIKEAEIHLTLLHKAMPTAPMIRALLGTLYAETNRPREARPLLESQTERTPRLLLLLADCCAKLGDADGTGRYLREARDVAKKAAEASTENHDARLAWARALVGLHEFPEALDVMAKGVPPEKSPDFYRRAMAGLCAEWERFLLRSNTSFPDRLKVIERGLTYDPSSEQLVDALCAPLTLPGAAAQEAKSAVNSMIEQGRILGPAHAALANEAWVHGRKDDARREWKEAHRLDPRIVRVTNNLAYSLAFTEPSDPEAALKLADEGLKTSGGDSRVRSTRGMILTKLGRWQEAITDLEKAMANAGKAETEALVSLAEAYDHAGKTEQAARLRKALAVAAKKPAKAG